MPESPIVVGVMSDTHGNYSQMFTVADMMRNDFGASMILHLGDTFEDMETLVTAGYPAEGVPGLWCSAYHDSRIPNRILKNIAGMPVVLVHAEKDLFPSDYHSARLLLVGHTHIPEVRELENGGLLVNPGQLKSSHDRGAPASFGIIEVAPGNVAVKIIGMQKTILYTHKWLC